MKRKIASKIVVLSVLLALIISAVGAAPAQAAGIYTHTWFVERAIQRLEAYGGYSELVGILNRFPAAVNYGSIFPDITIMEWQGVVGLDAAWSEIAHDTVGLRENYSKYLQFLADKNYDRSNSDLQTAFYKEFLNSYGYVSSLPRFRAALMEQMLDHFSNNPRSQRDEKMIAFLFGVIVHQEADIPWHWDLPNCSSNWKGLECAIPYKVWPFKWNELDLDNVLAHYDIAGPYGEHTVDFALFPSVKPIILAASDTVGQRPVCHVPGCSDALEAGGLALQTAGD